MRPSASMTRSGFSSPRVGNVLSYLPKNRLIPILPAMRAARASILSSIKGCTSSTIRTLIRAGQVMLDQPRWKGPGGPKFQHAHASLCAQPPDRLVAVKLARGAGDHEQLGPLRPRVGVERGFLEQGLGLSVVFLLSSVQGVNRAGEVDHGAVQGVQKWTPATESGPALDPGQIRPA